MSDHTSTDEYLAELGAWARERAESADVREWVAVAGGEVSVEDAVAHARARGASPAAIERDVGLFRPLGAAEQASILAALDGPSVAPRRGGSRRGPWVLAALSFAIATSLLLWWAVSRSPEPREAPLVAQSTLPTYELTMGRGLVESRQATSDEPSPRQRLHYRADTPFEWLLEPAEDVDRGIGVRVFASRGAETRRLDVSASTEVTPSGSVRIAGRAGALGLEPGDWQLSIVVGEAARLPDGLGDPVELEPAPWQRFERAIRIEVGEPLEAP